MCPKCSRLRLSHKAALLTGRGHLDGADLDLIFRTARTQNSWKPQAVAGELLRQVYDLAKLGPTAANSTPARFVFVVSKEGKEKLAPALSAGNVEKTMTAPVTVLVGYDMQFYDYLPELLPHVDARAWFTGKSEAEICEGALRNSSLQGAYVMIAARALGLDCGPMSGFDAEKLEAAFWPDGRIKANFICNIGYGDDRKIFARSPRLDFDRACRMI
jgi:3-hydroxypropanoate dehydrogenase